MARVRVWLLTQGRNEIVVGVYGSVRAAILAADEHLRRVGLDYWDGRGRQKARTVRAIPDGSQWHERADGSWSVEWEAAGHDEGYRATWYDVDEVEVLP